MDEDKVEDSEVIMKLKRWSVTPNKEVIFPENLITDPEKYGGVGMHMMISIEKGIVTVPINNGSCHVGLPLSLNDVRRVIKDGGVDIDEERYWCSIFNTKVFFKGTDKQVTLIRGLF